MKENNHHKFNNI